MKNGNKALSALNGIRHFISKNLVMCIAFVVAVITSVIVPVDRQYIGYFDFKTLTCLFCVLAVVCALKNIKFFYILADKIVRVFKNAKMCVLALVYITFIGSMLIANDMALLTFFAARLFCAYRCKQAQIHGFYVHNAKYRRKPRRNVDAVRQSAKSLSLF